MAVAVEATAGCDTNEDSRLEEADATLSVHCALSLSLVFDEVAAAMLPHAEVENDTDTSRTTTPNRNATLRKVLRPIVILRMVEKMCSITMHYEFTILGFLLATVRMNSALSGPTAIFPPSRAEERPI